MTTGLHEVDVIAAESVTATKTPLPSSAARLNASAANRHAVWRPDKALRSGCRVRLLRRTCLGKFAVSLGTNARRFSVYGR